MHKDIMKARDFATEAHDGQSYGPFTPYTFHLEQVDNYLLKAGARSNVIRQAAWLHDVIEDTPVTYDDVLDEFGPDVADIVSRVTNPTGGNRAWRHSQSYPRIAERLASICVKLADRYANLLHGIRTKSNLVGMYIKEHDSFIDAMEPDKNFKKTPFSDGWDDHGGAGATNYFIGNLYNISQSIVVRDWKLIRASNEDTSKFWTTSRHKRYGNWV